MVRHQQPCPFQQGVGHDGRCRNGGDLLSAGQVVQHGPNRGSVGAYQPARAQFHSAEIAVDDDGDVAQAAALKDRQHGSPGRAGRFSVVLAVSDGRLPVADQVGRDIVGGVCVLHADASDKIPGLVNRE